MHSWQSIHAIAECQHGLITRAQAHDHGVSSTTLDRYVAQCRMRRVRRSVFALPGSADTPRQRIKAVELAIGPPVAITGWSAAFVWGLVSPAPSVVQVVLPAHRRAPAMHRVRATRSRTMSQDNAVVVDDITVTSIPVTLAALANVVDTNTVRGLMIDAGQRRLTDFDQLTGDLAALGRMPGVAAVRRVLDTLGGQRPDSVLEDLVRQRLLDDGFRPQPDPEPCAVTVRSGRVLHVDIPFSSHRVGIECDGFGCHQERSSLDIDALRHNDLADVDWRLLRVTWTIYMRRWDRLTGQLARLIAARDGAAD